MARSELITQRTLLVLIATKSLGFLNETVAWLAEPKLEAGELSSDEAVALNINVALVFKAAFEYPHDLLQNHEHLFGLIESKSYQPAELHHFRLVFTQIWTELNTEVGNPLKSIASETDPKKIIPVLMAAKIHLTKTAMVFSGAIAKEQKAVDKSAKLSTDEINAQLKNSRFLGYLGLIGGICAALVTG